MAELTPHASPVPSPSHATTYPFPYLRPNCLFNFSNSGKSIVQ